LIAGPARAEQTSLDGAVQGIHGSPAAGQATIVSRNGHQFLRFAEGFSVASQAEVEIRLVDGRTGAQTLVGRLSSRSGTQVYQLPEGVRAGEDDRIVLYSPLQAEDLATVELSEE
jgi:hypothetical protein